MEILDIHTHHTLVNTGQAIINVFPVDFIPQDGQYYSVGFHPWYLSPDGTEDWGALQHMASHPQVLALGEAGLDKIVDVDYTIQEAAFEKQMVLASNLQKPLVIHCVRSYNEIMAFKKSFKPDTPWIIHGFRGKKELARQLTEHGIFLSYGFNYQEAAIRATPLDMLFLETDENATDIHLLYEEVAEVLSLSLNELMEQVQGNINSVFFKK